MKLGPPGYLLPDGECYTEELCCAIVFYPDKEEYRRALLGSIVYLSNWLAWERDADKRGKDAAKAWKLAVECTMECWNMKCLEDLIADVASIKTLMETKKDCCDDNISYYPTEEPTSTIQPFAGDPPELYGETEISDWEEWREHVCYNAHAYVDYLVGSSGQLKEAVGVSSIFIGFISATLALLAFSGIGLPIAFTVAAAVVIGLTLSATTLTFADTADDIEAAREEIVCTIINGYDLPGAIETALSSGTDWDLFYQFVDYEAALAIIHEGGYGTEFLPTETRDDCGCVVDVLFLFSYDADSEGFDCSALGQPRWVSPDHVQFHPDTDTGPRSCLFWEWVDLSTTFSFGLPAEYDQVRWKFRLHTGGGDFRQWEWYIRVYGANDQDLEQTVTFEAKDWEVDVWHDVIWNLPRVMNTGGAQNLRAIKIWMQRHQEPTHGQRFHFDEFGFYKK